MPKDKKSFIVTCADYVTMEDGTGVVHTALDKMTMKLELDMILLWLIL